MAFYSFLENFFVLFILALCLLALILWTFQNLLIYQPNIPHGSRKRMEYTHFHLKYDEFRPVCTDGTKIQCWLFKQREVDYKTCPTMLYFHGNAGNISHRLPNAEEFYRVLKCNVLLVEYRGYGYSEGKPTEEGFYQDAEAALKFLIEKKDIDSSKIVVFGRSIGGAVAIHLAVNHPNEVAALIAENTFTSLPQLGAALFPIISFPLLKFPFLMRSNLFPCLDHMKNLSVPTLFVSGRSDELIPPSMMDRLYAACNSSNKTFLPIVGGRHNETWLMQDYYPSIRDWTKSLWNK